MYLNCSFEYVPNTNTVETFDLMVVDSDFQNWTFKKNDIWLCRHVVIRLLKYDFSFASNLLLAISSNSIKVCNIGARKSLTFNALNISIRF